MEIPIYKAIGQLDVYKRQAGYHIADFAFRNGGFHGLHISAKAHHQAGGDFNALFPAMRHDGFASVSYTHLKLIKEYANVQTKISAGGLRHSAGVRTDGTVVTTEYQSCLLYTSRCV